MTYNHCAERAHEPEHRVINTEKFLRELQKCVEISVNHRTLCHVKKPNFSFDQMIHEQHWKSLSNTCLYSLHSFWFHSKFYYEQFSMVHNNQSQHIFIKIPFDRRQWFNVHLMHISEVFIFIDWNEAGKIGLWMACHLTSTSSYEEKKTKNKRLPRRTIDSQSNDHTAYAKRDERLMSIHTSCTS